MSWAEHTQAPPTPPFSPTPTIPALPHPTPPAISLSLAPPPARPPASVPLRPPRTRPDPAAFRLAAPPARSPLPGARVAPRFARGSRGCARGEEREPFVRARGWRRRRRGPGPTTTTSSSCSSSATAVSGFKRPHQPLLAPALDQFYEIWVRNSNKF
jgi:hypothetical protein